MLARTMHFAKECIKAVIDDGEIKKLNKEINSLHQEEDELTGKLAEADAKIEEIACELNLITSEAQALLDQQKLQQNRIDQTEANSTATIVHRLQSTPAKYQEANKINTFIKSINECVSDLSDINENDDNDIEMQILSLNQLSAKIQEISLDEAKEEIKAIKLTH